MQQLSFAFTVLLVCVLSFAPVEAIPTRARRQLQANSGMVTVPLKRLHATRASDLHPQVVGFPHVVSTPPALSFPNCCLPDPRLMISSVPPATH